MPGSLRVLTCPAFAEARDWLAGASFCALTSVIFRSPIGSVGIFDIPPESFVQARDVH